MWRLCVSLFKRKRSLKMNRVSPDAPAGMQLLQAVSNKLCPRLRINRLKWHRGFVLLITYVTYMTYHLTRKPLSVVKAVLHRNCSALSPPDITPAPTDDTWCDWPPFNTNDANTLLGVLDSAFLFSYAAAMFVSGMVAERVDLRYFLTLGMLVSSIFCYMFGLARVYSIHNISYYIFVQIGMGIAQTSGWPATVAIVSRWFGNAKKGLVFGIWNSHTSLGNILGTLLAAHFVEGDWSLSFIYPALVMAATSMVVWAFLVPQPQHLDIHLHNGSGEHSRASDDDQTDTESADTSRVLVGDQSANLRSNRHSANTTPPRECETEQSPLLPGAGGARGAGAEGAMPLGRALRLPGVLPYSISLFFAKLVSYTFLYWLPVYINTSTSLSARAAGELSTAFDAGAVGGAVAAGALADRAPPALVCLAFYALTAPALAAYQSWGGGGFWSQCLLLACAGALVNGPYALITTAVSAELGAGGAVPTVAALVDGAGSCGAALGPLLAGYVSALSWPAVFYMLIACDVLAFIALLGRGMSELSKLRQQRRMASPPRVRVH